MKYSDFRPTGPAGRLAFCGLAAALSVVLLAITCLIMFIYRKLGGKSSDMAMF